MTWLHSVSQLKALLALTRDERKLALRAYFALKRASRSIRGKSRHSWKHNLGTATALTNGSPMPSPLSEEIESEAEKIGKMVRRVARNVSFKSDCLPQACAAQTILQEIGIEDGVVFIGAQKSKGPNALELHAWLYVGRICVTGDDGPGDLNAFKPLVRYDLKP